MKTNKLTIKPNEWNLKLILPLEDDRSIDAEKNEIEKDFYSFINKWKNRTDYLDNPLVLKEALDDYESLHRKHGDEGKAGYYFSLKVCLEQDNTNLRAKESKLNEFWQKIENDTQFFELNIAKIPKNRQQLFLDFPGLKSYKHLLVTSFSNAKYMLTDSEEKIMNLKSQTSYSNWVRMTSNQLSKEQHDVVLENSKSKTRNFSQIMSDMNSSNKITRDSAAHAFNLILEKHIDTAEAEMNSVLEDKKTNDELRGMSRPDLARHISDDVESEIVDTMLKSVSDRFDLSKRFYRLKAKTLGLKKLQYHERNLEVTKIKKKYTFESSIALVNNVFNSLDKDFSEIFSSFLKNGQLDVYPKKGKMHGAFCAGPSISLPSYVLLNHHDELNDVLTIAHEMGHAINNELMKKKVHSLDYGTPLSTAEVASTFMEDFVLDEILKNADDELKFSIYMMKLNNDISSIFRQVACYRFELELHSNFRKIGYLSKDDIGRLFQKHMASYMGPAVEMSKGSENWWIYWGHIRQYFYVYSYASGLLISKSLQSSVKKDKSFIYKVKEFLSSGESDSPRNIFLKLGIDISNPGFWDKGLEEVEELLVQTEDLAKKLKKL